MNSPDSKVGPLDGVRVVDLTTVLMGPFATQLLGDMGADIIKIEAPGGDSSRGIGPMRNAGMGSGFMHVNRNKRSVVLDLKKPEGHEALMRLAETADVLLYNVRPAAMARLGLTYEALARRNPKLVYVGVYGYGQDGPYAAKPAYDDLIQGAIGVPSLIAIVGDGVPRYVPLAFIDRAVGLAAVNAVSAALYRREKTGVGQSIGVPMFETMVPFVMGEHMAGQSYLPALGPAGYPRQLAPERTPFPTKDGYVCALIYNDKHWRSFFAMIGEPQRFDTDPRLKDIGARTRHIGDLYAEVAKVMRDRTTAEWLERLEKADIPAMPLHTLTTLFDDPHLKAIGYFSEVEHPSEGTVRSIAPTGTWSESPLSVRRPAPRLGEHSRQVLAELGYTAGEIDQLVSTGVTKQAPPLPASGGGSPQ